MPIQSAVADLLTALAPIARRWGRWYVFDAQAVVLYGVPRLSADVDVTLEVAPESVERFVTEMQTAGFSLRIPDPDFVRRTRVIPFVHDQSGMPLDVVLSASGLEEDFLARSRPTSIGTETVPVIAPDDLIIAKVLAGRSKDIDDAAALWRLHGNSLDADGIRSVLKQLEEALDQSDLLPAFDRLTSHS